MLRLSILSLSWCFGITVVRLGTRWYYRTGKAFAHLGETDATALVRSALSADRSPDPGKGRGMTRTAQTEFLAALDGARAAALEGRVADARTMLHEAEAWLPRSGPMTVADHEHDARLIGCTTCGAKPGEVCVAGGMAMSGVHALRFADGMSSTGDCPRCLVGDGVERVYCGYSLDRCCAACRVGAPPTSPMPVFNPADFRADPDERQLVRDVE